MNPPNLHHGQRQNGSFRNLGMILYLLIFATMLTLFYWTSSQLDSLPRESNRKIRQISVLGERNSGTRWTHDHIHECFGHALKVEKNLTRHKHWFQFNEPSRYEHDSLVIAQFRNPYDWLKAMERVPHHAPGHLRTKVGANLSSHESENDWRIFLTREWTMERLGEDLALSGNEICQEHFHYRDVVSCVKQPLPLDYYNHTLRYSEHEPFYEMRNDGSGRPYENILELRTDKIRNFLSVRNYVGVSDVWIVQYEYLLKEGTVELLQRIEEWTGVQPRCQAIPPQVRFQKKTRTISPEFAAHVRMHLNWTVEAMIGYEIDWEREEREPSDLANDSTSD